MSYNTKTFFTSGKINTIKNFNENNQLHGKSIWYKNNDNNEYETVIEYENNVIKSWICYHDDKNKIFTKDIYVNGKKHKNFTYSEYDSLVEYKEFDENECCIHHDIYCEIVYKNLPFKLVLLTEQWKIKNGKYLKTWPEYVYNNHNIPYMYLSKVNIMFNADYRQCYKLYNENSRIFDNGKFDDKTVLQKYKYILDTKNISHCELKQEISYSYSIINNIKRRNDKKACLEFLSEYQYLPFINYDAPEVLLYKEAILYVKGDDGQYYVDNMDYISGISK